MSLKSRFLAVLMTCAIVALSVSGCSHTSRISTKPEGAEIWINNQFFGKSPITYLSRSGFPTTYYVKAQLPGYDVLDGAAIEKSYRADLSLLLLIPGILPYFFSARLEDQYVFTLRQASAEPAE